MQRGGAYTIEASRATISEISMKSLAASTGGEAGIGLQPCDYRGSMCPVEWRSGRAPSMTHCTARLEC